MRSLLLAAALAAAAAPAMAKAPVVDPDPMTVSGRFELPTSATYAGRVRLGAVTVHPAFAVASGLDTVALQTAVGQAARQSLKNFGYLAADDAPGAVALDIEVQSPLVTPADHASQIVVRLRAQASDACLARTAEGQFKVLERERSGGGRRALAIGSAVALAFVGVNAGGFVGSELQQASAQNRARNAARAVAADEGVAPGFGAADTAAYGGMSAVRLALADYLRQLGEAPACAPAAGKLAAS